MFLKTKYKFVFKQENIFNMETTIEKKLNEVLVSSTEKFKNSDMLIKFKEASNEFERLVDLGIVTKRGNNLISITDTHLHKLNVNKSELLENNSTNKHYYSSNI